MAEELEQDERLHLNHSMVSALVALVTEEIKVNSEHMSGGFRNFRIRVFLQKRHWFKSESGLIVKL
jgi:hypothetical protein